MAGGKETPRQKMIGMMYLVLTALLALNVSKEIIAAFVTLNDKLDSSAMIIGDKARDNYYELGNKRAALQADQADMTEFNVWNDKAMQLKAETSAMVGFILGECNDMIIASEGSDWVAAKDDDGNITKLKPLIDIQSMDNYDIPTNMFVGGNPNSPNKRGKGLRTKIHNFRDLVCGMMGTYRYGEHNWKFISPKDPTELDEALKLANPEDTSALSMTYRALTLPEKLHAHGEDTEMPWAAVTFDHAPIVAAAAMFTSLKLDIKNAESQATDFILEKIEAPPYVFNKIIPTAVAPTSYINQGDSLDINVVVAAIDTTAVAKIKWGMDGDTLPDRWTETTGQISLAGSKPGPHRVKGVIGVEEKGGIKWKEWAFDYNVGQPMGVIAQPNRRILYRGFENILEGAASGYPSDKVRLSSNQLTLTKRGNQWVAKPKAGNRTASVSIVAFKEDGSSVNLGSFEFKIKALPKPTAYFGGITTGSNPSLGTVKATISNGISIRYDNSVDLPGVTFRRVGGKVSVDGLNRKGKIDSNGKFDNSAVSILKQSAGKQVTIMMDYRDPVGTKFTAPIVFTVRG